MLPDYLDKVKCSNMMHILHIKQCSYKKAATKLIVVISLHINRMRVSREISRTVL